MMQHSGPILFFDSGVGGLSVSDRTRCLLPTAPFVYAADSAAFPYGTKSEAEIAARVPALLGRLVERYRPSIVVIACNTASTIALPVVRAALDVPVVGTVPAIKPAAALSRSRAIAVLGTKATVRQPYVDRLSAEFAGDCTVIRCGSSELVAVAEGKLRGLAPDKDVVARALAPIFSAAGGDRVDTMVLACTHFPLITQELAAACPRPITFVDGADGIARRIVFLTQGQRWPKRRPEGTAIFTSLDASVKSLAPAFAERGFAAPSRL